MNDKYFEGNPIHLDVSRSKFHFSPRWTGTWNTGKLVPIFATSLIQPGDGIYNFDLASAIRMVTPAFPTMDDLEITVEAYFVPNRLLLSRKTMSPDVNDSNHSWAAFLGSQDSTLNMPLPGNSISLPTFQVKDAGVGLIGGLSDCLGYPFVPSSGNNYDVNCLKVLAYYSIWNEFFREPNCQIPVTFSLSGNNCSVTGTDALIASSTHDISVIPLAPVSRYHGYFGSCLPWPQRNTDTVNIPLGGLAELKATTSEYAAGSTTTPFYFGYSAGSNEADFLYMKGGKTVHGDTLAIDSGNDSIVIDDQATPAGTTGFVRTNLYANLATATAASVNAFRIAVQTQRWYEHLARSGNKYSDMIAGMWGVNTSTLQDRPEYLGGFTAPISITQVASTAATSDAKVGATGAFSLSNPHGRFVNKSFTEHGVFMVVACVRAKDSFCQGISREDTKFDRLDYFWNEFSSLGEQPVLKKELYCQGYGAADNQVFGYQEAWAEYRMMPDRVTGYARPNQSDPLGAALTYCNNFAGSPTLKSFLDASGQASTVDRTLIDTNASQKYQFYGQFQFDFDMVRPMPLHSIPGLVDHH